MNIDTGYIQFQKFETGKTGIKFLKLDVSGFNNRKSNKPFRHGRNISCVSLETEDF